MVQGVLSRVARLLNRPPSCMDPLTVEEYSVKLALSCEGCEATVPLHQSKMNDRQLIFLCTECVQKQICVITEVKSTYESALSQFVMQINHLVPEAQQLFLEHREFTCRICHMVCAQIDHQWPVCE